MQQLQSAPPATLAGHAVSRVRDLRTPEPDAPSWRGPALLVELVLAGGGRVFVRPSGTEPKLKMYVDLPAPLAPDALVTQRRSERPRRSSSRGARAGHRARARSSGT